MGIDKVERERVDMRNEEEELNDILNGYKPSYNIVDVEYLRAPASLSALYLIKLEEKE